MWFVRVSEVVDGVTDGLAPQCAVVFEPRDGIRYRGGYGNLIAAQVPEGALVGLSGATGSGKSTLILGLLGELPPVAGPADMSQVKQKILIRESTLCSTIGL